MRKEVIAHKDPKSPISEVFRTLRTNIQFMNANKKMKTILVTSTFPGEGKSWVTSNLAVTFAQAGKKVVLIDADMRKGRQYAIFGVSPTPGLSNFLSRVAENENEDKANIIGEYIQETEVENLYVISSGNIPPNPSELLVSTQMITLLDELKELCDIIIIDGTPCELVTDSVILSRIVDSTVVVTAHKVTKKEALERVLKNIQNVGGNLAGVILNRIPISNKKYEEKYYYYGQEKFSTDNKKSRSKHLDIKEQEDINKEKIMKILNTNVMEKSIQNDIEIDSTENIENQSEVANENCNDNVDVNMQSNVENYEQNNETPEESTNERYLEKTNNILDQIKDYLKNEKKDLD